MSSSDLGFHPSFEHSRTGQWVVMDDGWMVTSRNMVCAEFYDAIGTTIEFWDALNSHQPPREMVD